MSLIGGDFGYSRGNTFGVASFERTLINMDSRINRAISDGKLSDLGLLRSEIDIQSGMYSSLQKIELKSRELISNWSSHVPSEDTLATT